MVRAELDGGIVCHQETEPQQLLAFPCSPHPVPPTLFLPWVRAGPVNQRSWGSLSLGPSGPPFLYSSRSFLQVLPFFTTPVLFFDIFLSSKVCSQALLLYQTLTL